MSTCPIINAAETDSISPRDALLHRVNHAAATMLANVWTLLACKGIICGASAFDIYLTIKYVSSLTTYELNPLGRWLMRLDDGPVAHTQQIAAFVTAKFLGTLIVLVTIQGIAFWRFHLASLIAIPLAALQLSLVLHLLFAGG